jgi:hypothetical protein
MGKGKLEEIKSFLFFIVGFLCFKWIFFPLLRMPFPQHPPFEEKEEKC